MPNMVSQCQTEKKLWSEHEFAWTDGQMEGQWFLYTPWTSFTGGIKITQCHFKLKRLVSNSDLHFKIFFRNTVPISTKLCTLHKTSLSEGDSDLFKWRATLFSRGDNVQWLVTSSLYNHGCALRCFSEEWEDGKPHVCNILWSTKKASYCFIIYNITGSNFLTKTKPK